MWFFPQIELENEGMVSERMLRERMLKERSLLSRIVIVSVLIHASMVIALFLGHTFFSSETLVLGKAGARVSMAGGSKKLHGVPPASAALPTPAEPAPQVQEPEKQAEVVPPPQAKKDDIPALPEKKKSEPKKQKAPVHEKVLSLDKQKEQLVVPAFTELKKKYTSLKKKEKAPIQKAVEVPLEKKETQKAPGKQAPAQEPKKEPLQRPFAAGDGSALGQAGTSHAAAFSTERLEFASDEPLGSDNVIVQEIEHHYRRPPGFDDHEPFVFTFEIRDGKAISIAPKGSEPLVMYSAVKEAVLKANFAVTKQSRKIELIIKSHA